MNSKKKDLLHVLYSQHDEPYGLSSREKLLEKAKSVNPAISQDDVFNFLRTNKTYTLHKLQNKKFPRQKIIASKPKVIMAADLADVRHIKKENNSIGYLLVCIDVFSRYMQVVPCRNKDANTMLGAIKKVVENKDSEGLRRLNTDLGAEFWNRKVKNYLCSRGVKLYSVYSNEIKSSLAERAIRTLKERIYRFITSQNSSRYIDELQNMVSAYNHSPHSGLKKRQTPFAIHNLKDASTIKRQFHVMYKNPKQPASSISPPLAVGEIVRLVGSARSSAFHKGYTQQNTHELFRIKSVKHKKHPRTYLLEDLAGEPIQGIFYAPELVLSALPESYDIKILRSRKIKGKKQYFVSWLGYPTSFNNWIDANDIVENA